MACATAVAKALNKCFNQDGDLRVVVVANGTSGLTHEVAEFRVYSKLLCAWSKAFERVLQHDSSRLEITDFSKDGVESFLRFLYSGELVADPGLAAEVAVLAGQYEIQEPAALCEQMLFTGQIDAHGIFAMLERSRAHRHSDASSRIIKSCCKTICVDPDYYLKMPIMLSPDALDALLAEVGFRIGDYELAKLILSWPAENAAARGHDLARLLQAHVQFSAFSPERLERIRNLATSAGLGVTFDRIWADASAKGWGGEWTDDLFQYLGVKWQLQNQYNHTNAPFVGCFLNLIPSSLTWKAADHPYGPLKGQEEVARNAANMTLQPGEHMTWFLPIHTIAVSGLSFNETVEPFFGSEQNKLELHCSPDGCNWELLWDSTRRSFSCRYKERLRWFKLSVKGRPFVNMLQLHGMVMAGL
eukprot:TRINITY_DN25161_c0_g1_i1.p1 TRINITY_DN25161_c0_g1~~TRINITY_DN25161_c0_g1_i1.p1  ORF type:complete len:426 (+),score=74.43 TRINITY_DN25161_c0_g1_i1:32-1279(+)